MQLAPADVQRTNLDASTPLDRLAHILAENHSTARKRDPQRRDLISKNLPVWKKILHNAYQYFRATTAKEIAFSRAGEWMLDNFYFVEQTFHQIEEDLPKGYFDQLPKLETTLFKDYPRVFALAWELTTYNQGQLDLSQMTAFVQEYQRTTPLVMGELWALPTMFRIGILEKLATSVSAVTGKDTPDIFPRQPILPSPPRLNDETVVANCFFSLRLLSTNDWKQFFEKTSRVEQIFFTDPAGIFPKMDFDTRNQYRSVVEELARHSESSEEAVASATVQLATETQTRTGSQSPEIDRKNHIGYYLVDKGRPGLEKAVGYRPGINKRLQKWILANPTLSYLTGIGIIAFAMVLGLLTYTASVDGSAVQLILVGILGSGIGFEAAVNLVNWLITHSFSPRTLPRLDFSEGIPAGHRTMVVIPGLLGNVTEIQNLLQEIELHYLSNPDPQLSFGLLTDYMDAPAQHIPEDDDLLAKAKEGIEKLNEKYQPAQPFFLFHRQRTWNLSEEVWMGWERKRGKLAEFNRLLLGTSPTTYSLKIGNLAVLSEIKYVITLDADTTLPQGSAKKLVATMAHPLNKPVFSQSGHAVTDGYTILQPRVEIKPTSANRSLFSVIFSGNTGLDLYTLAVSDVYQDLFGEGSYVGKGIYDVAAFEKSLSGQVRENTLLSHDLFEGLYGRAALVTDIVLYEEYPSQYLVHERRVERWIRGDWQLLPWLFPVVNTEKGREPNRLSVIDRWKIFDNLRRSLIAPITLLFFALAWLFLPGSPVFWTVLLLLAPAVTIAAQTIHHVQKTFHEFSLASLFRSIRFPVLRWAMAILFLPYEAIQAISAVATTLIRLSIARKHLLQWTAAAYFARSFDNSEYRTWLEMGLSIALNTVVAVALIIFRPASLIIALPILAAWTVSPQVAFWISRPIAHTPTRLSPDQNKLLERLARRTWAYFERFTGPEDHWLPPDHFQENPRSNIGHYTTPTNIGLYLVACLSAYDLGYIGLFDLAVRLRNTFDGLDKLERYRGHWLNWYDTQTAVPLPPRYVSTVDSGNLVACLITLKQGCRELGNAPLLGKQQWRGLLVILDILGEVLQKWGKDEPVSSFISFGAELDMLARRIIEVQDKPWAWTGTLSWLSSEGWYRISQHLIAVLEEAAPGLDQDVLSELQTYLDTLRQQLVSMQRNIKLLAPWFGRIDRPPRLFAQIGGNFSAIWQEFLDRMPAEIPSLSQAQGVYEGMQQALRGLEEQLRSRPGPPKPLAEARDWCKRFGNDISSAGMRVKTLLIGFNDIAGTAESAVDEMDFKFLLNEQRQVFHIGYNITTERLDSSFYDLLASEARIASLVAIAKGDVPQRHWLHLARPMTRVDGKEVLLSWSGTMFEYLMPSLFTRNYPGTFLSESCYAAISAQINYGHEKRIPWGISESGFFSFDAAMNYQYRAFGVPDLGYKRDLSDDLVVAPYASMLALGLQPQAVYENLLRFDNANMISRFGLYEAVDFTKSRLPSGSELGVVRSYMAHHQGMILLSACNYLENEIVIKRFHSDERIRSVELLLQEKIPENPHIEFPHPNEPVGAVLVIRPSTLPPWHVIPKSPSPQVHLLNSGNYSLLITGAGGGFSQWEDLALTRWQADGTLDNWGSWLYIKDQQSGEFWSATCQPIGCSNENQEVMFYAHKAEFHRWDHDISFHEEVALGADETEIRRVILHNDSDRIRQIKLFSYAEVALAPLTVDRRHPAFNKLFIESEYVEKENALVFHRRPRSTDEKPIFLAHAAVTPESANLTREYESDRARFIGRGHTLRSPQILESSESHLSGTVGETLDPIMCLAQELVLKPHSRAQVTFLTMAGRSRSEIIERLDKYRSPAWVSRAFDDARTLSEAEMEELGIASSHLEQIQALLSAMLYPSQALRAPEATVKKNIKGQSGLWAYGISGDFPIMLVHAQDDENPLFLEALEAYKYWRYHKAKVNLVIMNDQDTGYSMDLHNQLLRQLVHAGADTWLNQREGIFILRSDQLPETDKILLETVANVILKPENGTLIDHARRLSTLPVRLPEFIPAVPVSQDFETTLPLESPTGLLAENGIGGFASDGREYVIHLQPGQATPRPWINVIANPHFGTLISESGSGYSWSENSGENRLTPWQNDPVMDTPGEAVYFRDEETGQIWSPTPLPAGERTGYIVRHGSGYTTFESKVHGIQEYMQVFVDQDDPVKIVRLKLHNDWKKPRRITVTYFAEWVLGTTREVSQPFIISEFEPTVQALLAGNRYNSEFADRVAFLAASKKPHGLTADRDEFFGRLGSPERPAALHRIGLSSAVHPGLDPCAAIQLHLDLEAGQEEEVFFILGEGSSREDSISLVAKYQDPSIVEASWKKVHQQWDGILNQLVSKTPEPAMDLVLNRWLLYQTISCRLWGRSALYQSSGAFGFRDQLQDVMAVLHSRPDIARLQILEAASHQFEAGDVLHWWHPPSGRGVRTRISDDLLWLPYVTAEYVTVTGDFTIMNEEVPFLKGDPLESEEQERYSQYAVTDDKYTLFEHCKRALDKGLTSGPHGLPLMGTGDWNDGMNLVGVKGRGESIWLGWFLYATINRFVFLSGIRKVDAAIYRRKAEELARSIDNQAWDGDWYLRAFYDDGARLGSRLESECNIDSIAQSWAVLSGAANQHRAAYAMASVERRLIRPAERLVLLLTPPFDKTRRNPGYIKGYPPGVRENGGQYTHAAVWAGWAYAKLGQGDQAERVFELLNPVYHSDGPERIARYQVEPYCLAADIYSQPPLSGMGGWTWYTGSAGWMYRFGIEAILGISREGKVLIVNPCIPTIWPEFDITYKYCSAVYHIHVENPQHVNRGVKEAWVDGVSFREARFTLIDDGKDHEVRVILGTRVPQVKQRNARHEDDDTSEQGGS